MVWGFSGRLRYGFLDLLGVVVGLGKGEARKKEKGGGSVENGGYSWRGVNEVGKNARGR